MVDRAARPDYKPALPPLAPGSAQVAQLVEHATENRSVGGSIPPLGTIFYKVLFSSRACSRRVPSCCFLDLKAGPSVAALPLDHDL